jgi:hypothetical protein
MKVNQTLAIVVAMAGIPAAALAGPVPVGFPGEEPPSGGGYNPRTPPMRGVVANDIASIGLKMYDGANNAVSVNLNGEVSVPRGPSFTNIGANRNGGGQIQASWDEVVQNNVVYINTIIRSSDGAQFMPPTAMVNGQAAFFWNWRFGMSNNVDFYNYVTNVTVVSARAYFSDNGGLSFFGFNNIAGGLNSSNWNPGCDPGQLLASIGDGTNFVFLQYQILIVPAPAGAGALAAFGLFAARRRRR